MEEEEIRSREPRGARRREGRADGDSTRTCFSPKFTIEGVSRLDSPFNTTSMPLRRASAMTLLALPKSRPTTLIFFFYERDDLTSFLQRRRDAIDRVCARAEPARI